MNEQPLVSVICLCYNHALYVRQAIRSVLSQTYPRIELIIIDDASTDNSRMVIEEEISDNEDIRFIPLSENHGNCRAFNMGWAASSGKYIIDLAADDYLLPDRVSIGVTDLEEAGDEFGVHFTDVRIVDKNGYHLWDHISSEKFGGPIPQGYIFSALLLKYFINPVSQMIANRLLKELNGFDESLAYEDFDLWVRSAKIFKYIYRPGINVVKRDLRGSLSKKQYRPGSQILRSTLKICRKAIELCETTEEYQALVTRINYERKRAFVSMNWSIAWHLSKLKDEVRKRIVTL